MSQLSTDWLCIATEGDTVDGRYFERKTLIDLGETYNPELYAALIWPEHNREYGNAGEVLAAMWQEDDAGLVKLYAKIKPNQHLIDANSRGQLIYFSVELAEDGDFRNTGRDYLMGLGVTDSPASVGTSRLRFSKRSNIKSGYYRYVFGRDGKVKQESEMKKPWQSYFGIKPKFADESQSDDAPVDGDKLQALAEALNNLEGRVAKLEEQQTSTQEDVDAIVEAVDTEEFSAVLANAKNIVKNFSKLDERVTTLPKRKPSGQQEKKFKFL
ncbi:TPA: GPO family capsid scaffolding protein [Klebsiella pneumoniae]|nr:GPO family capsid scaffolding protein [Klebsiella pneumoniae]HBQ1007726.1 GPO family capsid scaffolding protein [Klebsiella pneumoniae]HBQ1226907.1 GPO family capsid scaffolding protein [Klebsiella pneumoniae]HBU6406153.1 GPO family capsid scaffolding protein [Klebsiella pneumoniae]HBU6460611.1 GPO family capsid scaffolding protein [Klebsiella pneumoniae]